MTDNKFDVILADPPWHYKTWGVESKESRSAEKHYPVMSIDEIAALDVGSLVGKNAALFIWITWPILYETREVIEAWGFEYKTIAWVWVKAKKSGFGFFTGLGYYTRANTEPCLLATRGKMTVEDRSIQALIYSPIRQHSQKPFEQYRKIEALYPGKKYLELFARRRQPGWAVWGNEVARDVDLEQT